VKAVDRFRAQEQAILVATDVAARGLDIKGVRCEGQVGLEGVM
jgi:ATP-dependent RNA helicase DDX24/MAK5